MDKKSIIGLVLIFLIFLGYMFWIKPSDEQIAEMRRQDSIRRVELWRADSLAVAEAQQKALEDSLLNASQLSADALAGGDSTMLAQWRKGLHLFESNWAQPRLNVGVENEVMQLDLTSMGASVQQVLLKKYKTFDNQPLVLINPSADNFDLACIDAQSNVINTKRIPFALFANGQPVTTDTMMHVEEQDSLTLSFRAYVRAADTVTIDADQYLEFRYIVRGDSYEVDFDINFHHISSYINTVPNMSLTWQNRMNRQEQYDRSMKGRNANRNKDSERFYTTLCYKSPEDRPDNLKDGRDDEKQLTTPLEWVAFKQQFFCAILMTDGSFRNAQQLQVTTDRSVQEDIYLCDMSSTLGLDYDASDDDYRLDMGFYFGPNKYRQLRELNRDFERMLPLGWGFFLTQWFSRFVIIPTFNLMEGFGWNYGIIIILLTLMIRIVVTPLTWNSYKTGAVMRHLKPEMEALNKKFPNQEQAMQKQQAMTQLQRRAGINPMAGCLPMLIQLPILWAMFRFYPASIELRQEGFLWCDDLSSYDSIWDLPFNIPLYGDHVSLFCLLMFAMQFVYTLYTMRQQQSQASMPGMKFMMYFMPFMMLFIFNSQSAALNIYYFFNLLFSIATMFIIRAVTTEEKVRARMAKAELATKGKPQKKSKFQQRLEEMQRMSEEMQKQQQRRK